MTAEQLLQLAVQNHQAGRFSEAEALYRQILSAQPDHFAALHMLGTVAQQTGRDDLAIELIGRALRLEPDNAAAHCNLATALVHKGQFDRAISAYQRAVQLKPDFAGAYNNLGSALLHQGQIEAAVASYEQAIRFSPEFAEAHGNLGKALMEKGDLDGAVASCRRAVQIDPNHFRAHNHLGNVLKDRGELDAAITSYRRAMELSPGDSTIASNLLYALQFHPRYSDAELLAQSRQWASRYADRLKSSIRRHENDRDPDRRLRIGYVSPDFHRGHCQCFFTMPLLGAHDRERFEIFCYSGVTRPDAITDRLRSFTSTWRSTVGQNDAQVAEIVLSDRIDILVDLTMHMAHGRPLLFARKPAPIQVAWLAYPGTTGLETIDYRLTDPHLDPPGEGDELYAEESIRLPETFWCYDPMNDETVADAPVINNGYVTFGCLGNFCKVNDDVLALWSGVLTSAPQSKLLLLCPVGESRRHVFEKLALDPARIEFVPRQPWREYLQTYNRIDIVLDTFPYNGHTTTLDSLWMGVPVVTLATDRVVGRAGKSLLSNVGLPELIAGTREEFVEIAVRLAVDLSRCSELRDKIRQKMLASPLCDANRFARGLEAIYRQIWHKWCRNADSR